MNVEKMKFFNLLYLHYFRITFNKSENKSPMALLVNEIDKQFASYMQINMVSCQLKCEGSQSSEQHHNCISS